MLERLQKIIADAGIASRRAAEKYIEEGRVSVNGKVVTRQGTKADPDSDEIRIDGKLISTDVAKIYLMLNKPPGYVTTLKDPEGRPIVTDLLHIKSARIYPVGRLDYDSEGLLILTNDGTFAQRLQHPRYQVPRTYLVKVRGGIRPADVQRFLDGIELEDGAFAPRELVLERVNPKSCWLRITTSEGRNRVIRRAFEALGHPVARLIRVSYGRLRLGDLKTGEYRYLTKPEIESLSYLSRRSEKLS